MNSMPAEAKLIEQILMWETMNDADISYKDSKFGFVRLPHQNFPIGTKITRSLDRKVHIFDGIEWIGINEKTR